MKIIDITIFINKKRGFSVIWLLIWLGINLGVVMMFYGTSVENGIGNK
ncbi:hypothetical protein [Paenibacillus pini]|nr:hypothetical protein [Paenibacillus pini]